MSAATVQQMADRVAALMEEKLHVRGDGLAAKLKRGGRALPRKVRREAEYLAQTAFMAQQPKVQLMLDDARISDAYDVCVRHLGRIGRRDRLINTVLGISGSVVFSVLVVAGLFIAVLVWRGFL